MFRALVKAGLARGLNSTGVARGVALVTGAARRPLVIGYHRVVEDFRDSARESIPAMLTSVRMLEAHLDWIGRRHRFVSPDELGVMLASGSAPQQPVAVVTFDDGYRDIYHHALPLLRRKGIPGGVFLVTGLTGTNEVPLHDHLYLLLQRAERLPSLGAAEIHRMLVALDLPADRLARRWARARNPFARMGDLFSALSQIDLRRLVVVLQQQVEVDDAELEPFRLLTWEMAAELRDAGIAPGSHTQSHTLLTREPPARVLEELAGSRREIRRRLDVEARHVAYPDGRFSDAVVSAAAAAGYRYGYSACRHRDPAFPLLTIPRRLLWENACLDARGRFSPSVLSCQVSSVLDLVAPCTMRHAVSAPRPAATRHAATAP